MELFTQYNSNRTFNIIDQIFLEDRLEDSKVEGGIIKLRATLNKEYDRIDKDSDDESGSTMPGQSELNYVPQTEDGYVGLEPPLTKKK